MRNLWTPAQDAILRAEYVVTRDLNALAEKLGHPLRALYRRARQLDVRRPRIERSVATRYSILALVLAARPEGMRASDLGHPNINAAGAVMSRLVARGHLYRGALGRRTVRYFTTQKAADRWVAANLAAHLAKAAMHSPKKYSRMGWDRDAPMHITPDTIFTYAPRPPAQVFRTNTFS